MTEVLEADGGEIVLFDLPYFGYDEPDPDYVGPPAALVNMAGDQFPGFIAILSESSRLAPDTFRAILRTIRTTVPTEPVSTAMPGP